VHTDQLDSDPAHVPPTVSLTFQSQTQPAAAVAHLPLVPRYQGQARAPPRA
jgi:hypothetical protein